MIPSCHGFISSMLPDGPEELFLQSPVAIFALDRDGKIEHVNPAARRLLATSPDRLLGRPILAFVEEGERARGRDMFERVLQGRQKEWTTRFRRGDAAVRVQWVRASPYRSDGVVRGILVFARDLTDLASGRPDRAQLERLLERVPGQFSAVVDTRGRIRYSSGLAGTHARDDTEALGIGYQLLLSPHDPDADMRAMVEGVEEDGQWTGTHWHVRTDGAVFPVRTAASTYVDPFDGRRLGMLVVGRDVSAETGWVERAAKAELLGGVGGLVLRAAEEIGRALDSLDARPDLPDSCEKVREAAHRSRRILVALSGLAEVRPKRERIRLAELLAVILRDARAGLPGQDARVELLAPDADGTVRGCREVLAGVFRELVLNALEGSGGTADRTVTVSVERGDDGMTVSVANAVSETAGQALHRAFEPFFTTKPGHLGLGLNVARKVVAAHDGRVWSEMDDAGRAVFSVLLPQSPDGPPGRVWRGPSSRSRVRTVLIVDDDEMIRIGVRRFFEKVGFEVREAWSGRSALAQLTAGTPPDVVLTDIRMADGTGTWLIGELARDFPDLLQRTLIITGVPDDPAVIALGRQTGCRIVAKPLDLPVMLELIDEMASRD